MIAKVLFPLAVITSSPVCKIKNDIKTKFEFRVICAPSPLILIWIFSVVGFSVRYSSTCSFITSWARCLIQLYTAELNRLLADHQWPWTIHGRKNLQHRVCQEDRVFPLFAFYPLQQVYCTVRFFPAPEVLITNQTAYLISCLGCALHLCHSPLLIFKPKDLLNQSAISALDIKFFNVLPLFWQEESGFPLPLKDMEHPHLVIQG